eukprot:scaffold75545_cov52-Cyclotella_meneghiniana.AAC.1
MQTTASYLLQLAPIEKWEASSDIFGKTVTHYHYRLLGEIDWRQKTCSRTINIGSHPMECITRNRKG